jgi:hypothetical protein
MPPEPAVVAIDLLELDVLLVDSAPVPSDDEAGRVGDPVGAPAGDPT